MGRAGIRSTSQAAALILAASLAAPAAAQYPGPYGAPAYPGAPPVPPWVYTLLDDRAAARRPGRARAARRRALRSDGTLSSQAA